MKETPSKQTKECLCVRTCICEGAIHFTLGIQISAHTYTRTPRHTLTRKTFSDPFVCKIHKHSALHALSLSSVHFNVIRNVCMPNQEQTEKAARRKSDKQQCHFIVKQLMRWRCRWLLLLQHIFCMCPFAHTIAELKYKGKRKIKEIKRRDTEFGSSFMSSSRCLLTFACV